MKQSMFNHTAAMSNGGCVIYNFYTGQAMLFNIFSRDYYEHFELYKKDHPMIQKLVEKGFLVEDDEIEDLKKRVLEDREDAENVVLTICPTLRCNFACPYCFETPRSGRMSEEVQENIVSFVKRILELGHTKSLNIMWYGGEPLLEMKIIESLSQKLIALCEDMKVKYRAAIITNGYLLTPDKAAIFEKCKIRYAQITLDGPNAEMNDKTRHLINGSGTYERILENIRNFKGRTTLKIRCNVHKENADQYPQLEKLFEDISKETGQEIMLRAGHMDGHGDYEDKAFSIAEYADFYKKNKSNFKLLHYEGPRCTYPKEYDFVIDEQGNLCKCLESVNHDDEIVGNVKDYDSKDDSSYFAEKMDACRALAWPEGDEECLSCKLLPVCLGGCPRKRRMSEKQCSGYKFALDEYVLAIGKEMATRGKK